MRGCLRSRLRAGRRDHAHGRGRDQVRWSSAQPAADFLHAGGDLVPVQHTLLIEKLSHPLRNTLEIGQTIVIVPQFLDDAPGFVHRAKPLAGKLGAERDNEFLQPSGSW